MITGTPTQIASSVATLADLEGLPDDAYLDGELAYVQDTRLTYQLDRSLTGAASNPYTASTLSGNGLWRVLLNAQGMPSSSGQALTLDTTLTFGGAPDAVAMLVNATVLQDNGALDVELSCSFLATGATQVGVTIAVDGNPVTMGATVDAANGERGMVSVRQRFTGLTAGAHAVVGTITCLAGVAAIDVASNPTLAHGTLNILSF